MKCMAFGVCLFSVCLFSAAVAAAPQTRPSGAQQPGPQQPGPQQPAPPPRPAPGPNAATVDRGTARVRVQVLTDAGTPIRDADIILSGPTLREGKSDQAGRFEFADLPAGSFTVSASRNGFAPQLDVSQVARAAPSIFTVADTQTVDRTIVLARGGVISGRVVDELGDPVVDGEIRIERYVFGWAGRRLTQQPTVTPGGWTTNDRGEYRVYGLPPGEFIISVRSRQFNAPVTMGAGGARERAEGWVPTYFPGTSRVAEAQPLRVGAGQQLTADFIAVPGRLLRISGTVRRTNGVPPVGYNVYLGVETSNSSQQLNGGAINADGSFTVSNVPPGDFVLRVRQPGIGSPEGEVASMRVSLSTQDLTGLQLTTRRGVTIRGRIEWEGMSPRPTATMRVSTRSTEWSPGPVGETTFTYIDPDSGTVRENDTFQLNGITGKVLFSLNAAAWAIKSVSYNSRDVISDGLDTTSFDENSRVVIVMTDRISNLSGTVRDTQGRPVLDYIVVVVPQQPMEGVAATRFTRTMRPDRDGAFALRGLPPGDYVATALASLEGGREWDPDVQKAVRSAGSRVAIGEGEAVTVNLELLR